jgi:hypothetical protein
MQPGGMNDRCVHAVTSVVCQQEQSRDLAHPPASKNTKTMTHLTLTE